MQIPKRIDSKTVAWYTEPDYCLYDDKSNIIVKLPTWEECYNYWINLGKPWNYRILNRMVGNYTLLQD